MKTLIITLSMIAFVSQMNAQSNCHQGSIDAILNAVNNYRADKDSWKPVEDSEYTLVGAPENEKGSISLSINKDLNHSATETAKKLAAKNSFDMDHNMNGSGATVRALNDGWFPSFNKIYTADIIPPFTMVLENFEASTENLTWLEVLNGWKNSIPHNSAILTNGGVSIGCGCETNASGRTYWVLLIEAEGLQLEPDANMDKYFGEGSFYREKQNMKGKDLSKYKAYEVFEFMK